MRAEKKKKKTEHRVTLAQPIKYQSRKHVWGWETIKKAITKCYARNTNLASLLKCVEKELSKT